MIQVELYYDDSMIQTKCIDVIMNNSENLSYNIFSQAYNIRSLVTYETTCFISYLQRFFEIKQARTRDPEYFHRAYKSWLRWVGGQRVSQCPCINHDEQRIFPILKLNIIFRISYGNCDGGSYNINITY